jgi:hypothetical protein
MLQVDRRRLGNVIRINQKCSFMLIRLGAIEVQMGIEAPCGPRLSVNEFDRFYQSLPAEPSPTQIIFHR